MSAMLANAIYDRIKRPNFTPFTLVLASGERIRIRHPDSVVIASAEHKGRRVFSGSLTVLERHEDEFFDRVISLPLVAQVVDDPSTNGVNGH